MNTNENVRKAVEKNSSDMLYPFNELYEKLGYEGLLAILEFRGISIYVPNPTYLFRNCIEKEINEVHKYTNPKEVAIMYGINEKTVKEMRRI